MSAEAQLLSRIDMKVDSPLLEIMFDQIPTVMFFAKDLQGRYIAVNSALVEQSGRGSKSRVLGKTSDDLFSVSGPSTMSHDLVVMSTGVAQVDELRMFYSGNGRRQWCLDSKYPVRDGNGSIIGLVGISRILSKPEEKTSSYTRLLKFIKLLESSDHRDLRISLLAEEVKLSMDTLERLCRTVYGMTPKQIMMRTRLERACRMLEMTSDTITDIAIACGYFDHSAFSRQFKVVTKCTPQQFRAAAQRA